MAYAKLTMGSLLKNFPDRYKLVAAAAQRAKALNLGEKPVVDTKYKNSALIALEELISGKVKLAAQAAAGKGAAKDKDKEKK